ncbi:MAG: putative lipase, partial [Verrucomicrobiaceae bacterium]|nr:putative lipase [Verrucomicrobiaceae bacterium]
TAIWNRVDMCLGALAANTFAGLLTCQVPLRLGLDIDLISPVKAAAFCSCPLFVIHGTKDHHACLAEGRAIFDACPHPQKQWWAIQGAGHVDLGTYAGAEYQRRVLEFLDAALK